MTHATALPWTRTSDGLPEPAWLNSRRSAPLLFVVLDSRQVVHGHYDFKDSDMPWWSSDGRRAWAADAVSHWMYEPVAPGEPEGELDLLSCSSAELEAALGPGVSVAPNAAERQVLAAERHVGPFEMVLRRRKAAAWDRIEPHLRGGARVGHIVSVDSHHVLCADAIARGEATS